MPRKKQNINENKISGIKYAGKVTIEKVYDDKVVKRITKHNVGCLPLFTFLVNCLYLYSGANAEQTGLFNSKPQYLNAFYQSPDSQQQLQFQGNERLKTYISQSSMTITTSDTSSLDEQKNAWAQIDMKFLLQSNNFKFTDSATSSGINILALYSGDSVSNVDNPQAFIIINDVTKYLKYQEGANYIITWSLKISN